MINRGVAKDGGTRAEFRGDTLMKIMSKSRWRPNKKKVFAEN